MKKLIIIAICLTMAGCGLNKSGGFEEQVFSVVDKYLHNAAAGNWGEVYDTLSGEALTDARINAGRVKAGEKIISKNLKAAIICTDIVEVSADVTKGAEGHFDRQAYKFRLKKTDGRWLIYRSSYGEYLHGELRPGQLPGGAAESVRKYMELPLSQKHAMEQQYLAGRLLADAGKARLLPTDRNVVNAQDAVAVSVSEIRCLGVAADYAVALVIYDSVYGGREHLMEALVDLVNINGAWKLCRMDITKI